MSNEQKQTNDKKVTEAIVDIEFLQLLTDYLVKQTYQDVVMFVDVLTGRTPGIKFPEDKEKE